MAVVQAVEPVLGTCPVCGRPVYAPEGVACDDCDPPEPDLWPEPPLFAGTGPALVRFVVPGSPKGAARHRTAMRGNRAVAFHAKDHVVAERDVTLSARAAAGSALLHDGPVTLHIVAWFARPQRLQRKKDRGTGSLPYVGKPDADNVAKLVMDGMTKAGVWRDDTQVATLVVERRYVGLHADGTPAGEARVEVLATTWSSAPPSE